MFDELHNNTRYMIRLQHEALQEQEVRHQAAAADLRAALEEEAAVSACQHVVSMF